MDGLGVTLNILENSRRVSSGIASCSDAVLGMKRYFTLVTAVLLAHVTYPNAKAETTRTRFKKSMKGDM